MVSTSAINVKVGSQITFNEIYPKTLFVTNVKIENWANTVMVIINNGEYKIIGHHKISII